MSHKPSEIYATNDWSFLAQPKIEGKFSLLAGNPQLGPAHPDIAEDCRYVPVGRYLILYRIIPDGMEVVRVVQGSRRLEHLFP